VAVEDDAIRATALARDQTSDKTQVTAGEIGVWEHHDYGDVTVLYKGGIMIRRADCVDDTGGHGMTRWCTRSA
jgi:hypothetical protein